MRPVIIMLCYVKLGWWVHELKGEFMNGKRRVKREIEGTPAYRQIS